MEETNHYEKIQIHREVLLRKAINLSIFLFFFYCKQEQNLKTHDYRVQNKTRLTSTVSDPENSLCYSSPWNLPFFRFPHTCLKKYLPMSKLAHYCSQIARLLKSSIFKVRLTLLGNNLLHTITIFRQWECQIPVLRKPSSNQTFDWGASGEAGSSVFIPFCLHEEHKQGEKREVPKWGGKSVSLLFPQLPLLCSKG